MGNRRYSVRLSGASTSSNDKYHDGKMSVRYCYAISDANIADTFYQDGAYPLKEGEIAYEALVPTAYKNHGDIRPFLINYKEDGDLGLQSSNGIYMNDEIVASSYSIYRREYDIYQKPGTKVRGYFKNGEFYYTEYDALKITPHNGYIYIDIPSNHSYEYDFSMKNYKIVNMYREYKGEWEPVVLQSNLTYLRDYNITNGRSYQYIIYPHADFEVKTLISRQQFANYDGRVFEEDPNLPGQGALVPGTAANAQITGEPISTHWNEWSLIELEPITNKLDLPIVKQAYRAKMDQLWLFRFSLETGTQAQNISRSEFQTLGQYPKVGYGKTDYASGEVSALLGSEIIPYGYSRYIERKPEARNRPLSTNEKTALLKQWQKLVSSKNPKLLKDIKGQSWIVQIFSSSNRAKNFYYNQPDTITFQWKQIADPSNVIIYGDGGYQDFEKNEGTFEWKSIFK